MKKIDNKALISKSTLLGATVGLISAVLIIILSFDAPVIKQTQGGLRDLFFHSPDFGRWSCYPLSLLYFVTTSRKKSRQLLINRPIASRKKQDVPKWSFLLLRT